MNYGQICLTDTYANGAQMHLYNEDCLSDLGRCMAGRFVAGRQLGGCFVDRMFGTLKYFGQTFCVYVGMKFLQHMPLVLKFINRI